MIVPMPVKAAVAALFWAASFYAIFLPSGPLNAAAWWSLIPLDALVIGYYVHKRHFIR